MPHPGEQTPGAGAAQAAGRWRQTAPSWLHRPCCGLFLGVRVGVAHWGAQTVERGSGPHRALVLQRELVGHG